MKTMKKLAIFLLILLPFTGFSQKESSELSFVNNTATEATSTTSAENTDYRTNELPSYLEDDLKLYDGLHVIEKYLVKAEDKDIRTIRYNENPKVYYEVELEFSDDKTVKIQRKINKEFFEKLYAINHLPQ